MKSNGDFDSLNLTAYPGNFRKFPALSAVDDKYVFVIGGESGSQRLVSCLRFILATMKWDVHVNSLNTGRSKASSCFLGGNIYVFAGHGQQAKYLSSIEQLKVTAN